MIESATLFPLDRKAVRRLGRALGLFLVAAALTGAPDAVAAQGGPGTEDGEWRYLGGDAWHTRYSPLGQVNADNFEDLETAWLWRADNYGPFSLGVSRSTPSYVDGMLYTVAGERRQVAAIDPATGETLWTFREPHTTRFDRSPRVGYGKGVAYGEVDGRGVIYIQTPAFFLWALDAKTGQPLENWGSPYRSRAFPRRGEWIW